LNGNHRHLHQLPAGADQLDADSLLRPGRAVSGDVSNRLIDLNSRIQRPPSGGLFVWVPELTCGRGIQLNERVRWRTLQNYLGSTYRTFSPSVRAHTSKAVRRSYSAWRLCCRLRKQRKSVPLASNLDEGTLPHRHQFHDDRMALLHLLGCRATSLGHCGCAAKGSSGKPSAEDWASISPPPKTADLSRPCSSPFMTDYEVCADSPNFQPKAVVRCTVDPPHKMISLGKVPRGESSGLLGRSIPSFVGRVIADLLAGFRANADPLRSLRRRGERALV
jgi:hypothetical protein